jgi:hypothetical protein
VGLDHAAGALAFDDVHHDRPAVRAGEFGSDGHAPSPAQPERHIHYQHLIITGIVVDDKVAESIRVEPRAVPCHGSSRLAMTSSGSQVPGLLIPALTDSDSVGRRQ